MHLVGLIMKKFVTMHGHMNVKYVYTFQHVEIHVLRKNLSYEANVLHIIEIIFKIYPEFRLGILKRI